MDEHRGNQRGVGPGVIKCLSRVQVRHLGRRIAEHRSVDLALTERGYPNGTELVRDGVVVAVWDLHITSPGKAHRAWLLIPRAARTGT